MAPTQTSQDVTFGVELEFICVRHEDAFAKLAPYQDCSVKWDSDQVELVSIKRAIWYKLKEAGIEICGSEIGCDSATNFYSEWIIDSDDQVLTKTERHCVPGYLADPIELSSPVFKVGDGESLQQIERVLQTLESMETEFDCRFLANKSCGLHVHIGCGKDTIVPLSVAKRVFQLTTAHEHNLDALHATSRILIPGSKTELEDADPYVSLSFFHRNRQLKTGNYNVYDWLRSIEEARSYVDLSKFFQIGLEDSGDTSDGHTAAVNFDNLTFSENNEDVPRTIEFRQHVGTLDFAEISRYVHFLGKIFEFCYQANDRQFIELLVNAMDVEFTLQHLMQAVCGPSQPYSFVSGQISHAFHHSSPTEGAAKRLSPLDALKDQNAREVAANHNTHGVNEIRARKTEMGLYGVYHRSGALRMHPDAIPDFMTNAVSLVLASNSGFSMLSSQARAVVFGKLATMYRELLQPSI